MYIDVPPVPYLISETLPHAVTVVGSYLAWRFVRAYERRNPSESLGSLNARVALLEETVERVATNVEQSVDAQRFTTRVLLSRGGERDS